MLPYTYVFDADGDKIRTVQFRGAGILSPASLFFSRNGHLLVTPGLYEFQRLHQHQHAAPSAVARALSIEDRGT